jgi:hypothetical protein
MCFTVSTIRSGSLVPRQIEGVDPGQLLEEHGLALHDRHRRLGSDVAEAEHGGAVGDHRHRVLLDGERERSAGILVDGQHTRATPGV